jgi:O-antigen ligase
MTNKTEKETTLIRKLIFGFLILFLITLTNSIFFCQIGYFIPLILFIYVFISTRENPFKKNGLELAFILFLAAELISACLSVNRPAAFQNFFKRMVLIPLVYVITAGAGDKEKAKLFVKIYLGAALLTMIVYIGFAYEHFTAQLYRFESKGPSPFQYVMTAGGLMSFTTIFFFAFLINEKRKITVRLFYLAAFLLAAVGLYSSYTRAAWMGAVAGIVFIVLIKRKWWMMVTGAALILFAVLYYKNESKIYEYKYDGESLVQNSEINTPGRASSVEVMGDTLLVADYEGGMSLYTGGKLIEEVKTETPSVKAVKWGRTYLSGLLDSRIVIFKHNSNGKLINSGVFTSPGKTNEIKLYNQYLYTADEDSGLTVFHNPANTKDNVRFRKLGGVFTFDMNDSLLALYDFKSFSLKLFRGDSNESYKLIDSIKYKSSIGYVWVNGRDILFQTDKLYHFIYRNGAIIQVQKFEIVGLFKMLFTGSSALGLSGDGKVFRFDKDSRDNYSYKQIAALGYSPTDFTLSGDKIFVSMNKRNRFASVIDPYYETNFERLNIWRTGLKIFSAHPFFGVGDIDLNKLYGEYKEPYLKENFGHMHNNFVHFLVILGSLGFCAAIFMIFKILQIHFRIYNSLKQIPFASSYALGALAAFIGFLFSGLGEWNFGDQEIITMVWFTLGLNIAFYRGYLLKENPRVTEDG